MKKEENHSKEQPNEPPRKSWFRRPRFQYSISTLLLITAIFALWLGHVTNRARKQREAVKELTAVGALISYDWEYHDDGEYNIDAELPGWKWLHKLLGEDYFQEAVSVSFTGFSKPGGDYMVSMDLLTPVDDDPVLTENHFNHLKSLPRLSSLEIENRCPFSHPDFWKAVINVKHFSMYDSCTFDEDGFGDQELRGIGSLKNLISLYLCSKAVSTASLEEIGKLTNLQSLVLEDVEFHDEDLAYLKNLKSLRSMHLCVQEVEGNGLKYLPAGLEHLEIHGLLSGVALKNLRHLKSLNVLILENGEFLTNEGLQALGCLDSLRELEVSWDNSLTGDFEGLKGLKGLKKLDLSGLRLSGQDIEKLGCLPNLTHLDLSCDGLAEGEMRCFEKLKSVTHLTLWCRKLNEEELEHLKKMPKLQLVEFPLSIDLEQPAKTRIEKRLQGVNIGWDHGPL
ncbi:MAG: leucine-rich repeat domain-containing protein [Pirellulales bacterium]|nr:leucine-rich repeat domain-containing protein [Pirellulales bacterium]